MIKKDHFLTGFIPGIIFPLVGFYIYYLIFFPYMGLQAFVAHLQRINMTVSVMSLGVILNLALFFGFYQYKCDRSARGVVAATMFYAFIVLFVKVL